MVTIKEVLAVPECNNKWETKKINILEKYLSTSLAIASMPKKRSYPYSYARIRSKMLTKIKLFKKINNSKLK